MKIEKRIFLGLSGGILIFGIVLANAVSLSYLTEIRVDRALLFFVSLFAGAVGTAILACPMPGRMTLVPVAGCLLLAVVFRESLLEQAVRAATILSLSVLASATDSIR